MKNNSESLFSKQINAQQEISHRMFKSKKSPNPLLRPTKTVKKKELSKSKEEIKEPIEGRQGAIIDPKGIKKYPKYIANVPQKQNSTKSSKGKLNSKSFGSFGRREGNGSMDSNTPEKPYKFSEFIQINNPNQVGELSPENVYDVRKNSIHFEKLGEIEFGSFVEKNYELNNKGDSDSSSDIEAEEEEDMGFQIIDTKGRVYSVDDWKLVLQRDDFHTVSRTMLRKSLFGGVPHELRGSIWAFLSRSRPFKQLFADNVYTKLLDIENIAMEEAIRKDVNRTFPCDNLFLEDINSGQNKLFNLLKAYANYDTELGYCQGTNYIAALLLLFIPDEQLAFYTFVKIMFDKHWRHLYLMETPKLMKLIKELKNRIKRTLPQIYNFFIKHELHFEGVFSHFFLTMFIYQTPLELAVRIFDIFLYDAEKIIFQVIVKMLKLKQKQILKMDPFEVYTYVRASLCDDCFKQYTITTLLSI